MSSVPSIDDQGGVLCVEREIKSYLGECNPQRNGSGSNGGNDLIAEGSSGKMSNGSASDDSGRGTLATAGSAVNTDDEAGERDEQLILLQSLHDVGGNWERRFEDFYILANDHLGSGAYACVRTAISIATREEFAVKLVDKNDDSHTRSRILREVEVFELCKGHPNIIQLIEWFEDDANFYMVFEKMHGGPLLTRIQQNICFTEQEAGLVTRDIAAALKYLHDQGVAHRDIKPENILCTDSIGISPVKLCDLDLASKPSHSVNCMHEAFEEPDLASPVGSAEFMAPEVVGTFFDDSLKYDKRCDMWSLGVIIYIMLCGYPPFYGECDRRDCGWDQGGSCDDCQNSLFRRIQKGILVFPEEWDNVSHDARDLVEHLLIRDVSLRYSADNVLKHPWVIHSAPNSAVILQTASNLYHESQRGVQQMSELFKNCQIREV